ncbi:hypothetical protein ACMXYN_17450 [Neptuniibacter sp. PT8_73]|uniref:hypothetical protein n=1 Tax=Neptuniibacter sp. PT8_73 TaxID=3398206 RepID=UPI0039F4D3CF
MTNVMVWILRLPFLGIIYAVIMGLFENSSALSKEDWAMSGGGISLCIGVCIAAGLLNKPMPAEEQSKIVKRMNLFFMLAAAGIVFGRNL